MAIGKDKVRILVNLPKELKEELEKNAENHQRSLSNYIVYMLTKYKDIEEGPI